MARCFWHTYADKLQRWLGILCEFFQFLVENILQILISYHYRQVSNIRRTLVGNKIVDHSDVVGASPVGAAPTTSSFSP